VDPEIVKKINEILNDESILVEDKIEKISEILDEMNDNGEDFVEEEYWRKKENENKNLCEFVRSV